MHLIKQVWHALDSIGDQDKMNQAIIIIQNQHENEYTTWMWTSKGTGLTLGLKLNRPMSPTPNQSAKLLKRSEEKTSHNMHAHIKLKIASWEKFKDNIVQTTVL